ncbi:MAG: hypothetical protein ACRDNB_07170 [Gaiellaceae bacterium]
MVARIVLWSLADSKTTIEELRRYLRDESVDAFADVEGLRFKAWISDPSGERWGAFYLFESLEAAEQPLPGHARELIGKDPDVAENFSTWRRRSRAATRRRISRGWGSPSNRERRRLARAVAAPMKPCVSETQGFRQSTSVSGNTAPAAKRSRR